MGAESPHGADGKTASWREAGEAQLLAGMRDGFHGAFAECYRRFAPMLARMAQRRHVPAADEDALVADYLEDTLIPILRGTRPAPSPLGGYLAAGFRRRLVSVWRARERENARRRSLQIVSNGLLAGDPRAPATDRERVVAEGLSEFALRSARPPELPTEPIGKSPDEERHTRESSTNASHGALEAPALDPLREARHALANALARHMTSEERQIMGQVAERYPQREIATAFGMGAAGMRMRILRLRERMAEGAARYINALPTEDGILLARFLATPLAHRTTVEKLPARHHAGHGDQGDERV